jgi:hypothetical protein
MGMARQSRIYSTPEKYMQPCEINLNIADHNFTNISTFPKNITQNGYFFVHNMINMHQIKTEKYISTL